VTKNHTVAVCDILGFTNAVRSMPLDILVERHLGRLRKALYRAIYKDTPPSDPPPIEQLRDQSKLGIAWFSDTILLFTSEDTDESLSELTSTLGWLLFETILDGDLRLRCGVACGSELRHNGAILACDFRREAAQIPRPRQPFPSPRWSTSCCPLARRFADGRCQKAPIIRRVAVLSPQLLPVAVINTRHRGSILGWTVPPCRPDN